MSKKWTTREQDLQTAQSIMEEYAQARNSDTLGLFEIVVNPLEKRMDYCLSGWVLLLAKHFTSVYGSHQGDFITRQVITRCITQNQTLH